MARRAPKRNMEKANDVVEFLLDGFKPVFGSLEDMSILNQYGKIKQILSEIDSSKLRQLELEKLESAMTDKMKDVRYLEEKLIQSIKNRKQ